MNKMDRSLARVYKDLLITKRELTDLRHSISNTIRHIRETDRQLKKLDDQRMAHRQLCLSCFKPLHPANPHSCSAASWECSLCSLSFDSKQKLQCHEVRMHETCPKCHLMTYNQLETHLQYVCGEEPILCETCQRKIKRKDLDRHVSVCSYRQCQKCKQSIYCKAFGWHLQECRKATKSMITNCKKLKPVSGKKPKGERPDILPCCLVVENQL